MYEVIRQNGKVLSIKNGNSFIPLVPDNKDYQEFLKWQDAQPLDSKLDISDKGPDPIPLSELRKIEYEAAGVTVDSLVIALWESIVENRPESIIELQNKRIAIKAKYPKPEVK